MIDLIGHSASHQGYQPLSGDYLRALHRMLASPGHVVLFIGEVNGVGCRAVHGMRRHAPPAAARFNRSGEAARLSVPAAITWEAMRWVKAAGLRWFDFGGLRAPTLQALLDGGTQGGQPSVDRFKTSFGGAPYRYPVAVEMIHSPLLRITYGLDPPVAGWAPARRSGHPDGARADRAPQCDQKWCAPAAVSD